MKNKRKLPKSPPIPKEVSLPDPPLKADELTDFLEQCHKKNPLKTGELVNFIEQFHKENTAFSNLLSDLLPILLFVEEALYQESSPENLLVRLQDRDIEYSSLSDGARNVMAMVAGRIYQAINGPETWPPYLESAVDSYREAHPKAAAA